MVRPEREIHSSVLNILQGLRGIEPLKELFWSQLNYQRVNESLSRRGWPAAATSALAESPVLFAAGGEDEAFHVIYGRLASEKLRRGLQRPVISRLLQDHPYALFVFSDQSQEHWHFVNVKLADDPTKRRLFRRITVGPYEKLRTASERIAMLDLEAISPNLFGISALDIQAQHDEAFDVEAVTKQFFDEYKAVFQQSQQDLAGQTSEKRWAHDYALQFLNRCMFIYFVQRKGWLGDDPEFLGSFWRAYNNANQPADTFFGKWLSVLFFQAFNNRFHGGNRQFPDEIRNALQLAPYLNGGLFAENELDRKEGFGITDGRFRQVFTFLERYNFTIAEDSPIDQEVAVDPEMIGKVYESLVNVSEEADERGEAGIFYTPRTEIDLMCRLALVDNLANNIGEKHKNLFYEAVFALEQAEKDQADKALAKADLWPKVAEHLRRITVADPACGSGSFLVGMLHILDDLQERAGEYIGRTENAYDRRKRIIGQNLYGVDVMEWACHVAELRLWLALIIDAEIPAEERTVRAEPLLPHFTFKIRCGDSLVQEVGGVNLGHRRGNMEIPRKIKARLTRLQKAKLAFYDNRPLENFKTVSTIRNEEVVIFRNLLAEQTGKLDQQAKTLMRLQAEKSARQRNLLTGKLEGTSQKSLTAYAERERQIATIREEVDALKAKQSALRHTKDLPLVWDIAFAEVMESDTGGFDIVVGNPPYVRQESIADPHLPREKVTTANKKQYKAKLARSVYQVWPRFFGYKRTSTAETVGHKISAKSDLYIYFYFYGLSLLNETGSFCFITSNSWLDVGYGKDLQEFLLKHGHVKFVLDNQVKRSFAAADVNTIIALFSRPEDNRQDGLKRKAHFVMFKAPFEQIVSPVIFEEIEDAQDRKSSDEYRAFPVSQEALLKDGREMPEEPARKLAGGEEEPVTTKHKSSKTRGPLIKVAKYIGNKWGGKYLRAPDIYWAILEKGKGKLTSLGNVTNLRRGITTGANEFFFLEPLDVTAIKRAQPDDPVAVRNAVGWHGSLERKVLRPGIQKVDECGKLVFHPTKFIFCPAQNPSRRCREYIGYGEKAGFSKRQTCAARRLWWKLRVDNQDQPHLGFNYNIYDTGRSYLPKRFPAYFSDSFHVLKHENLQALHAYMNSTVFYLFVNVAGRIVFGGGKTKLQTYELAALPAIDSPEIILEKHGCSEAYSALCGVEPSFLLDELDSDERTALDAAVFDTLGLTRGEREAVYEAVIDLVEKRLGKAKSV